MNTHQEESQDATVECAQQGIASPASPINDVPRPELSRARRSIFDRCRAAVPAMTIFSALTIGACQCGDSSSGARRHEPAQRSPERPEELYGVDIDALRQRVQRDGILVISHNGLDSAGNTRGGEDEYRRIVENTRILGRNVRTERGYTEKSMRPIAITGRNARGADVTRALPEVKVYVVDGSQGRLSQEATQRLRGKKFGFILVAGHIYDLDKIVPIAQQFQAVESVTFLGGCRGTPFLSRHHTPTSLYAASTQSIRTEQFTHFLKVSTAALMGEQFQSWPEYFGVISSRYSREIRDNPSTYIFPGNQNYGAYVRR